MGGCAVFEKTKSCAGTFKCRFRFMLKTFVLATLVGVAVVYLFIAEW